MIQYAVLSETEVKHTEAFDVLATRGVIIWIALAAAAAILKGMLTPLLRAGAKGNDPSIVACYFAFCLALGAAAVAYLDGSLTQLMQLNNTMLLRYVLCGVLSALTLLCMVTALTGGLSSKVAPILNVSTVVVIAASYFLFGTAVGLWRICCLLLILLGTVLILSRTKTLSGQFWFIYALLALVFYAALNVVKTLLLPETGSGDMLYQIVSAATAAILLLVFALARGKQKTLSLMSAAAWICTPLSAFVYAGGWACTFLASRYGEMSMLAPISILSFASMLFFSRAIMKERQPVSAIFGSLLVMLGMFAILMGF